MSDIDPAECGAHIHPMRPPNDVNVTCLVQGTHSLHNGILRDYAYPGSGLHISWHEEDRRNFRGEWPGACGTNGCFLPLGHRGSHAS